MAGVRLPPFDQKDHLSVVVNVGNLEVLDGVDRPGLGQGRLLAERMPRIAASLHHAGIGRRYFPLTS